MRWKAAVLIVEILMDNIDDSMYSTEVTTAKARGNLQQWIRRFTEALSTRFDHRGMRHAAAVWRKWRTWRAEQPCPPGDRLAAPDALSLAIFLDDGAGKGPTAAWGVLNGLKWLAAHAGLHRLPLSSPLLMRCHAPGTTHVQKHANELKTDVWFHLMDVATRDAGAVSLIAKATLFLAASSLRFRHAQRALFVQEECTTRTLVVEVTRGKVHKGAPFRLAIPTHVAPQCPMFLELHNELKEHIGNPGYLIPDVNTRRAGGLCPESMVMCKPMSYNKFMGCMRAILMAEPLSMTLADAREITTYSLRRKMPTVADRLRLSMEMREELGNWRENINAGDGAHKKAREPMAVRYSAAKLESSAQTRRMCLLAISKLKSGEAEDMAIRNMAGNAKLMQSEVLGADWGTDAAEVCKAHEQGLLAQKMVQKEPAPESRTSSSAEEEEASRGSTDAEEDVQIEDDEVEWALPGGSKSKIHWCRLDCDPEEAPIPYCRNIPFAWGCTRGLGMRGAEETGREWSPRCKAALDKLRVGQR